MVLNRDLQAMLDPVPGTGTNCRCIPISFLMSASIAPKEASASIGPETITWRGIIARTDYLVADEGIVVVGVAALTDNRTPDSALDRLNAEITAVVACQQRAAFEELKCFAALTRNGATFRVWHCDIVRTRLRISRHFRRGNPKSLHPQ
ncbi:MAG: hypothetical protein WBM45_14160, partial [Woeseiaceae bacterium]